MSPSVPSLAYFRSLADLRRRLRLTGLITMVHHTFGGLGAYLGAAAFDRLGGYDLVFVVMAVSNVLALALTAGLRRQAPAP